jgi:tRNA G18 (ribose-2'-O)-methylase SpoU
VLSWVQVSESVIQAVGDTVTSQGVVAAFRKPLSLSLASLPSLHAPHPCSPYLVLDNISDPGNLGTLIRSSYGLGTCITIIDTIIHLIHHILHIHTNDAYYSVTYDRLQCGAASGGEQL